MPVIILPGETRPSSVPAAKLKVLVDEGKRVVLPDYDCAISRSTAIPGANTSFVYLVEPLDADYVEERVMDASVDNSDLAEQFDTFEEALASAQGE